MAEDAFGYSELTEEDMIIPLDEFTRVLREIYAEDRRAKETASTLSKGDESKLKPGDNQSSVLDLDKEDKAPSSELTASDIPAPPGESPDTKAPAPGTPDWIATLEAKIPEVKAKRSPGRALSRAIDKATAPKAEVSLKVEAADAANRNRAAQEMKLADKATNEGAGKDLLSGSEPKGKPEKRKRGSFGDELMAKLGGMSIDF